MVAPERALVRVIPPFEQQHALAALREHARDDAAGDARAHHDHVIVPARLLGTERRHTDPSSGLVRRIAEIAPDRLLVLALQIGVASLGGLLQQTLEPAI